MDTEDPDIWEYARKHDFIIVTFDADFYDLSLLNGHPPKIIWLRTGNLKRSELVNLLTTKKEAIEAFSSSENFREASCLEIN